MCTLLTVFERAEKFWTGSYLSFKPALKYFSKK